MSKNAMNGILKTVVLLTLIFPNHSWSMETFWRTELMKRWAHGPQHHITDNIWQGHTNNLAHPALSGLIIDFFYTGVMPRGTSSLRFSTRKYRMLWSCSQPLQYILFFVFIPLIIYGSYVDQSCIGWGVGQRQRCHIQTWHLFGCLSQYSWSHVKMWYLQHSPHQDQVPLHAMGKDCQVSAITDLWLSL